MSIVCVELPESLRAAAGEFARQSGLTFDQLVASALAEKVAALAGTKWLEERAVRGDRAKFDAAMKKVADVEPEEHDRL